MSTSVIDAYPNGIVPFAQTCFKPIGIELERTPDGRYWAHELWHKDLALHLEYFPATTLASPTRSVHEASDGWLPLAGHDFDRIRVVELPVLKSFGAALRHSWSFCRRLDAELAAHDVLYAGFVEWPIPYGWYVVPLLRLRRRPQPLFSFLESAFWRLSPGVSYGFRRRVRAVISERLTRWCLRRVDLVFVTQQAYAELVPAGRATVVEINASWIDEEWVRSDESLADDHLRRERSPHVRVLFAGRLEPEKGVSVLFDAVDHLVSRDGEAAVADRIRIDVVGAGSLEREVNRFVADHPLLMSRREQVPYGGPFLELLREYDVVVIPSLSDEQPRLVYDAFSQGLPVLASDTPGLRACVSEQHGVFFGRGEAVELADRLDWWASHRRAGSDLGSAARLHAATLTHAAAHRQRYEQFRALLSRASTD
jgi:glycosyltransferase involved in cell wall biosynthesis